MDLHIPELNSCGGDRIVMIKAAAIRSVRSSYETFVGFIGSNITDKRTEMINPRGRKMAIGIASRRVTGLETIRRVTGLEAIRRVTGLEVIRRVTSLEAIRRVTRLEAIRRVTRLEAIRRVTGLETIRRVTGLEAIRRVTGLEAIRRVTGLEAIRRVTGLGAIIINRCPFISRHVIEIMKLLVSVRKITTSLL
ncbi:collagen triple helix repeat family protein [Plakobranchus ocellatus]|uniref:Collagen triple helix repeat family protein n=1 Tax=Plakobranchus ocellatus TaxID=259542 RepID=A0AAV4DV21_9GAST|nr:collagen triple helix repeat family protein [Plakobranchus ocellatus]